MMLAILILTCLLVLIGIVTIYLLLKEGKQANKARAPVLRVSRPGGNLWHFSFWLKNHGQTEAKKIEISYDSNTPLEKFKIEPNNINLAQHEERFIHFYWLKNLQESEAKKYRGELEVKVSYKRDNFEPGTIELIFYFDNRGITLQPYDNH